MANEGMHTFQVPPEMRSFAEKSVEQAKQAFDGFMSATQRAVTTLEDHAVATQAGAKDITQRTVGFAERNVAASFEFAQNLTKAKTAEEMMKLHADYVKSQMQAFSEQAREIGQTAAKMGQSSRGN